MSPAFRFGILLIFSLPGIYIAKGQPVLSVDQKLNLTGQGRRIENIVCFNTPVKDFERIKNATGEKNNVYATELTINDEKLGPKEIKTRGQSSLYFQEKEFQLQS